MNTKTIDHFYVFYTNFQGHNCYERTCGTEEAAKERVVLLKKTYPDAVYFHNDIPKDFKYFY